MFQPDVLVIFRDKFKLFFFKVVFREPPSSIILEPAENHSLQFYYCPEEEAWSSFKESLFTAADKCIPKVQLRHKKKTHWLSGETLRQIRKKKRLYMKAKRSEKQAEFLHYRRTSNMVRRFTRKDHHDHLEEISQ